MNAQKVTRTTLALLALVLAVAVGLASPAPAAADGAGWQGEYFNNLYLWGAPAFTRIDSAINFNWGTSAPDPRVPADGFSVRWSQTAYFEAGAYRFNVESDDGIRLYLDGALILDQWRDQSATAYSVERLLSAGNHSLRVEYFEHRGDAVARLWWQRLGDPTITEWRGEYFNNRSLSGSPSVVRNDAAINFDWGVGAPAAGIGADGFSVRWSRTLNFAAGRYRFTGVADDGVRLYIDGALVINQWRDQSATAYSAEQNLSGGNHTIVMEYYENTGAAVAQLQWQPVGVTPPPAPSAYWRGEYFNNSDLAGTPVFVRNDNNINFRWGYGSPDGRLAADYFSVRWARAVEFAGGRYIFTVRSDDGVRLLVDGRVVLSEWRDMGDSTFNVTVGLSAGVHTITLEYYERTGAALVELSWRGPMELPSGGNLITCIAPTNSWLKVYQLTTDGTWLDVNPRGYGPIAASGYLKIDGLPVDYLRWGAAGNPYRIEVWANGRIIRSAGNTAAGQPEWRLRPNADNYTPWGCPVW